MRTDRPTLSEEKTPAKNIHIAKRTYDVEETDHVETRRAGDTTIAIVSFFGDQREQGDAFACNREAKKAYSTVNFKSLTHTYRIATLKALFTKLNTHFQRNIAGSTACLTIAWMEDIPNSKKRQLMTYTAYQGNNSVFLMVANAKNEVTDSTRLNLTIHDPELLKNKRCVSKTGGVSYLGSAKVSRALGNYYNAPLNPDFHVAEITSATFEISEDETAHIINVSDGMTETMTRLKQLHEYHSYKSLWKDLGEHIIVRDGKTIPVTKIMKQSQDAKAQQESFIGHVTQASLQIMHEKKESPDHLAYYLAQWGYILAHDNITVMTMTPNNEPVFTAIFDGHKNPAYHRQLGNTVSKEAAKVCENWLENEINNQYAAQWQAMVTGIKSQAAASAMPLPESKTVTSQHVVWLLNQLIEIDELAARKKPSTKFFTAVNSQDEAKLLLQVSLNRYLSDFVLTQTDQREQKLFHHMVTALAQLWEKICKSNVNKTDTPITTTDMLNFLYCNSGKCVFQYKIGCLLQALGPVCRAMALEGGDIDKVLRFPNEPVLANASCLSSCFGLKC